MFDPVTTDPPAFDREGRGAPGREGWIVRGRGSRVRPLLVAAAVALAAGCGPSGSGNGEASLASREAPAASPDTTDRSRRPPRGRAWVVFGGDTVVAEVADSPEEREQGLMHRTELPEDTGMFFVFENEASRSFWMRNTYVPLDVAFFDSALRIVDIQQMEPETEEYHTSAQPAMFALEVPRGWFDSHGVRVGDQAGVVFGPR